MDAATPVPEEVFAMWAETSFPRLCALLVNNPARGTIPVLARIGKLGIGPGPSSADDSMRRGI